MARMIKLTNGTTGNDIYINVDLIRTVSSGPDDGASIRFDKEHAVLVRELPSEVIQRIGVG